MDVEGEDGCRQEKRDADRGKKGFSEKEGCRQWDAGGWMHTRGRMDADKREDGCTQEGRRMQTRGRQEGRWMQTRRKRDADGGKEGFSEKREAEDEGGRWRETKGNERGMQTERRRGMQTERSG